MPQQHPPQRATGATKAPPAPTDKHWFIPDAHGVYCQACGLPKRNRRHTPKVA